MYLKLPISNDALESVFKLISIDSLLFKLGTLTMALCVQFTFVVAIAFICCGVSVNAVSVHSVDSNSNNKNESKSELSVPNRFASSKSAPIKQLPGPAVIPKTTSVSDPTFDPTTTVEPTKFPIPTEEPTKPTKTLDESTPQPPLEPLTPSTPTEPLKSFENISELDDKQRMNFFNLFKSARPEDEDVQSADFRASGSSKTTTHVGVEYDNYTSFICYRESTSRSLAMLIKVLLDREKIAAFLDVEDLKSGYWDEQLDARLNGAQNIILILSKGSLDPCLNDTKYDDLMHQEIREAVITGKRIIPIFDQYDFPSPDIYSEEIQTALRFQGVDWQHQFTEASFHKLLEYLSEPVPPPPASIKGYKIHATTSQHN